MIESLHPKTNVDNSSRHVQEAQAREGYTYKQDRYAYRGSEQCKAMQDGVDLSTSQRCSLCLAVQPLSHFHVSNLRKTGVSLYCKNCDAIRIRAHRIGIQVARLKEIVAEGTAEEVPGLLLPHLLRGLLACQAGECGRDDAVGVLPAPSLLFTLPSLLSLPRMSSAALRSLWYESNAACLVTRLW